MNVIPFDKKEGYMWYNGNYIPWQDAKIHIMTHSLHYATSAWEGIRVYNGKIFKLAEHNQRFINSAKYLYIKIEYSLDELNQICLELVDKQKINNGYIRPIAWKGCETMKIDARICKSHVAIAAWEMDNFSVVANAKLDIARWRQFPQNCYPHMIKGAGAYMMSMIIKNEAVENGYDDAIILDTDDFITETSTANIFFIHDNKLVTPIADTFLNGITRQVVIQIAHKLNIPVSEAKIKATELVNIDAAFLTGTAMQVSPIASIRQYDFDTNHPILSSIAAEYRKLVLE